MGFNKGIIIKGLAASAAFAASVATGIVKFDDPIPASVCNEIARLEEIQFRRREGYNLTDGKRSEFLRIEATRKGCVENSDKPFQVSVLGINI